MSGVPDQAQATRRTSERLRSKREEKRNHDPGQEMANGSEGSVQDQIIIAPEIMRMVLEQLDFRALKKVRLVCKSWLLEAQSHMEERGIVWLGDCSGESTRLQEFDETRRIKIRALPQPFKPLNLVLDVENQALPQKPVLRLLSELHLPLVTTRFSVKNLPLTRTLPLIIKCSSSLEHIKLYENDSDADEYRIIRRHQGLSFQKLRHLAVEASGYAEPEHWVSFTEIVSWIMNTSPHVDTFDIYSDLDTESLGLEAEMLVDNDISNVTTLKLAGFWMGQNTSQHILSLPFSRLQNLTFTYMTGEGGVHDLLTAIATKAAGTLRKLEVWDMDLLDNLGVINNFPVCPNVQELYLDLTNPNWSDFVSRCFPSLQEFYIQAPTLTSFPQLTFAESASFFGVNTLRVNVTVYRPPDFSPMELFRTFPELHRLHIHQSMLLEYLRMKTSDPKQSVDYFEGLKHLELKGSLENWFERPTGSTDGTGHSWFAELKGINTLAAVTSQSDVSRLPVKEMPSLKVLRISWTWGGSLNMKSLLKITKQVENLVISDCCSVRRHRHAPSMNLLETFFDAAPNALCGCKEEEMLKPDIVYELHNICHPFRELASLSDELRYKRAFLQPRL